MNEVLVSILGSGVCLTAIGTLGSGIYFFITGARANRAEVELFESEVELIRSRIESAKVANRVANEMGRKLASVEGLGEFAIGFEPAPEICNCSKCLERRGEGK